LAEKEIIHGADYGYQYDYVLSVQNKFQNLDSIFRRLIGSEIGISENGFARFYIFDNSGGVLFHLYDDRDLDIVFKKNIDIKII
jgi:hypothetical protein